MERNDAGAFFRFRRNDSVGAAEAESDEQFLFDCFVDIGDLAVLQDNESAKRIVVGRTGAGKSALLRMLENREEHVINLPPQNLALSYLANSEVIRFFESVGTNLDVFYQLLWRHVLVVELLKYRYKIHNEESQRGFLSSLQQLFQRDKAKEQAVAYLREWGEKFWNETEYRVKEITSKIEDDLKGALNASGLNVKIEAGAATKLTEEEKKEVVQHGSRVVNHVQIKQLADVLRLLSDEIFNDPKERHYIVIDDLDTQWVEDSLKYRLVRALIETVKSFRQVKNVKVVVSIRQDLLHRVISATKDSGFQSEKYESMYLRVRWNAGQLKELLDKRIAKLIRQRYTTGCLKMEDLFPNVGPKKEFVDYLIDRTSYALETRYCLLTNVLSGQQIDKKLLSKLYLRRRQSILESEWILCKRNGSVFIQK
ncbi:MAG: hypothetical protein JWN23_3279 [Rhodocyclales bacterium]|nr:hypothetical protein [Rhodocyclales bacterium]